MNDPTHDPRTLEDRLRRAAPPLRALDRARAARACARLAAEPAPGPARASPWIQPRTFTRPLLRVAALLVLLLGLAALLRPKPAAAPDRGAPPEAAGLRDLAALFEPPRLDAALAGEADKLTDDLAALSEALNARALSILF